MNSDRTTFDPPDAPKLTSLWRIVPYYFLLLFGGLLAALALASIPMTLLVAKYFPVSGLATAMAGGALSATGGVLWMASARAIRWSRWRLLIVTLVAGYACGGLGISLIKAADLRHLPVAAGTHHP